MSKEQTTQIQKALDYVRKVAMKQNKQEQQQTLTLLLSAVSSHIRIMLNPPKPAVAKKSKSKKSTVRKPTNLKPPSINKPKPQNQNPNTPNQPIVQQPNAPQDLEARRDALATVSPNSPIP